MKKLSFKFSGSAVDYYFEASFTGLKKIVTPASAVLLTDENVFKAHENKFRGWRTIILKPGEDYKVQASVNSVVESLIAMEAASPPRLRLTARPRVPSA